MTDPTILCATCPVLRPKGTPRLPRTPQCCDGCRDRLSTDLTALPDAYAAIGIDPVHGTSEIRSRAYESKPPLNINALSLTGPGEVTPLAVLDFWAQDWAGYLEQAVPDLGVYSLTLWLAARLPWACDNHPAIDDFAEDLREITGQLRAFANRDRGERVGNCPRAYGTERCNNPLFVDPYVNEIQCTRCKQTWKRRDGEWMHLRAQQISAGVEAA